MSYQSQAINEIETCARAELAGILDPVLDDLVEIVVAPLLAAQLPKRQVAESLAPTLSSLGESASLNKRLMIL